MIKLFIYISGGGSLKNNLVVKHNNLVEAKYDLNLVEQKVILFAITKIDTSKEKLNTVRFNATELAELIGSESSRYSEFRIIGNSLMDKKIYLKDRPNLEIRWASRTEYLGNGIIELGFDDELVPYLLQLKSTFTRYQIKNILYLENKHSIRFYELMKQYQTIGKRQFKLEELKDILMIEGQYERFYDFERFILKKTKKEINKHTDINIDYEKIKTGRKITSILFKIECKDNCRSEYINYLNETYNIKEMQENMGLKKLNLNSEQIIKIYEKAIEIVDDEEIAIFEYIRLNYEYIKGKKGVRNIYSYLLQTIEEDFASARGQINLDYYL